MHFKEKKGECIKTSLNDQMMFFGKKYCDQLIRMVIYFKELIDIDCLLKSIKISFIIEPVLNYSYIEKYNSAYWILNKNIQVDKYFSFENVSVNIDSKINDFLKEDMIFYEAPLLKIKVFQYKDQSIVCFKISHLATDGKGLQEFVYNLADIYSSLKNNKKINTNNFFKPIFNNKILLNHFQLTKIMKIYGSALKDFIDIIKIKADVLNFPWNNYGNYQTPYIILLKIFKERFSTIKIYSKKHGVTLNDIFIASFLKALTDLNIENENKLNKSIVITVDLRKYFSCNYGLSNMSGLIFLNFKKNIGESVEDTLCFIKNIMKEKKKYYFGLSGLLTNLFFKFMSYNKRRNKFQNIKLFIPIFSNFGIINSEKLKFHNLKVYDAFISGGITNSQSIIVTVSTIFNQITFSCNFKGNSEDKRLVDLFFKKIDFYLPS